MRHLLALLLLAAAPDPAADWTIAPSRDGDGCFLTRDYPDSGGTTLLLGLGADGGHRLSLLNPNWSIRPKARETLSFRLSRGGYASHEVVGIAADGRRGFVTAFDRAFPPRFAASRVLHVDRGEVPVARLSLAGSAAAMTKLRSCVAAGRASAARPDRAALPSRDPFAADAGARREK